MTFLFKALTFSCVLYLASAEVVRHLPCDYFIHKQQKCAINKVEVNPCPEANTNEACLLYKNTNTSVNFEFTPDFNSSKLFAQVYSATLLVDLPLPGQDTNGCHYTTCPTVAGRKQQLEFSLPIIDYYPAGPYVVKWKVWNENNEECCFTINIAIV